MNELMLKYGCNPNQKPSKIFMQDGRLYAKFIDDEQGEFTSQLYPIGKKTFGRKGGFIKLTFGKDCVMYNERNCKKL